MDVGRAGYVRPGPSLYGALPPGRVSGPQVPVGTQPSQAQPETPLDSATLGQVGQKLQKERVGLVGRLRGLKLKGAAAGALAVGAAVAAVAVGGPVALALGGVALASGAVGAGSALKHRQTQQQVQGVDRFRTELWNDSLQSKISPERASQALAILESPEPSGLRADRPLEFQERYGPWAVVTGASSGIGREFAEQLAAKGINPVLVARNEDKLNGVAAELKERYGVEARVVTADLSDPTAIDRIDRKTRDLNVGLVVNNAGSWAEGEFLGNDLDKEQSVLRTNTEAPMKLSHLFGQRFSERGAGGILNVGSALAHVPTAYQANYAATKAYLNHFSKALNFELGPKGVDVMVVNPGATKTEGTAHIDQQKMPIKPMTPQAVVSEALDGLGRKSEVIPGFQNSVAFGVGMRALPQSLSTFIVGSEAQKFMESSGA